MRPSARLALLLALAAGCGDVPAVPLDVPDAALGDAALGDAALGDAASAAPDAGAAPVAEPAHRAGRRLAPQWAGPPGGPRRFASVWDRELETACWLTRGAGADTETTCFPRASGLLVYLDAACTQAYVETRAESGWVFAGGAVRVGPALPAQPAARYLEVAPGRCSTMSLPPYAPVREIAERLPPERLARGRVVDAAVDDALIARTFEGDDGSRFLYALVDRVAETECGPAITEVGARCRADIGELHDEGLLDRRCERLTILDYGRTAVASVPERGGAVFRFTFPGVFGRVSLGRAVGGACVPEEREVGRHTVHEGTPYPPEAWPHLASARHEGGGLIAEVARLTDGARAEPETRLDARRMFVGADGPCGIARAGGVLRCMPAPPAEARDWMVVYADRACAQRALAMAPGAAPPARVALWDEARDGVETAEVHAVGARLDPRTVFEGGSCAPVLAGSLPASDYYALGAAVPASEHPPLELTHE